MLPLYKLIAARICQSDYIKIDETPVRCLEPGTGKTASGYFWVYHHDEHGVLFDWHKSRANTCLDDILIGNDEEPSFDDYLQSDGLRAYRAFINRYPELCIIPVSCLTHIARKFKESRHEHPRIAARSLLLIGSIYQVEKRMDLQNAHPLDRQRARWLESRKSYDHLLKLTRRLIRFRGLTRTTGIYKALAYAIEQLPHLEPCFLNGQIKFDNNLTENAIRPTKLGHKNWMFIGGEHTGWRSAVIYTFAEQIRRHKADPFAYFEWVFEKLMHNPGREELEALLPVNWIKTRSAANRLIEIPAASEPEMQALSQKCERGSVDLTQELALAKRVGKGREDFVIPLKIDDLTSDETTIELTRLNSTDFRGASVGGLAKLLEKLEKDGAPKDPRFNAAAVATWW